MTVEEIHEKILKLSEERDWTGYKVAKECGMPYSTYYNMMSREALPTIETIEKLCDGFGITLAQFFAKESFPKELSQEEVELLKRFRTYDKMRREKLKSYIQALSDMNIE